MSKITADYIMSQYRSGIDNYSFYTKEVGLWASEKHVFQKYLEKEFSVLDLGCGTGRTTFPLFKLGFQDIIGVDLTPEMIAAAKQLNHHFQTQIRFETGNATHLAFDDHTFHATIFSFNGLMSIPGHLQRVKAIKEIHRVLKIDGLFIFTTHDRDEEPSFFEFWKKEKEKWLEGNQNPELYEFGDLITSSKNESREIFIHIPNKQEIVKLLNENGFNVLKTFYRSDHFNESPEVKKQSGECRFWIASKK
jgi:SAM-dependent methyltransferase